MGLAWLKEGSLLEQYLTKLYDKTENTKRAYLLDLCVFFRELFTEFWDFSRQYNMVAQDILLKYLENQGAEKLNGIELKRLKRGKAEESGKGRKELVRKDYFFPGNKPVINIFDGRLRMNLNPQPKGTIEGLVELRQEDYELINIVFGKYGAYLGKDFFEDIFRVEKLAQVMEHLKASHGNSNNTLARRYSTLKSFEYFLEEKGLVERVKMYRFPRPREIRNAQPYLSEKEMLRFLESVKPVYTQDRKKNLQIRDRAMFELLYGTGARISELIGIEIGDEDLEERVLFLQRTKGGRAREVSLPQGIISYLRKYELHRERLYRETEDKKKFYFLNCWGRKMNPRGFFAVLEKYLGKAGINKKIGPHAFRRSAAIHMEERGASIRQIQQFLGHQHITTTEEYLSSTKGNLPSILRNYHPRGNKR